MPNKKENKLSKQEKRICKICGKEFRTSLIDKICCSDKCLSLSRALNLQKLFDEGKIAPNKVCDEAFYEITNFMKGEIARELIRKGYFKNGVRQDNFGDEELLDCYIFVMDHVFGNFVKRSGKQSYVKYDPNRINKKTGKRILLASFINSWIRGFCSLVRQQQRNEHKINKHRILSLDEVTETYTPEELIEDELTNNINNKIEKDIFMAGIVKKCYNELYMEISEELEDINIDFTNDMRDV
jgi:hypothetical protein